MEIISGEAEISQSEVVGGGPQCHCHPEVLLMTQFALFPCSTEVLVFLGVLQLLIIITVCLRINTAVSSPDQGAETPWAPQCSADCSTGSRLYLDVIFYADLTFLCPHKAQKMVCLSQIHKDKITFCWILEWSLLWNVWIKKIFQSMFWWTPPPFCLSQKFEKREDENIIALRRRAFNQDSYQTHWSHFP